MPSVILLYSFGELHVISIKCKILPFHITLLTRLTCVFTSVIQSEFFTKEFKTTSAESSEHPPELPVKKNTSKSSKLTSSYEKKI